MAKSRLKGANGLSIRSQKQRDDDAMASVQVYQTSGSNDRGVNNNNRYKVILHDDGKPTYSKQGPDTTKYLFNEKAYNKEVKKMDSEHRKWDPDQDIRFQMQQKNWESRELEGRRGEFVTKPNPNYGKVNKSEYKNSDTKWGKPGGGLFGKTIENVTQGELYKMERWLQSKPKPVKDKNPLTIKND